MSNPTTVSGLTAECVPPHIHHMTAKQQVQDLFWTVALVDSAELRHRLMKLLAHLRETLDYFGADTPARNQWDEGQP